MFYTSVIIIGLLKKQKPLPAKEEGGLTSSAGIIIPLELAPCCLPVAGLHWASPSAALDENI